MLFERFFDKQTADVNNQMFSEYLSTNAIDNAVNESNSLEVGVIYACVNIKANAVAKLPLQLFRKSGAGRERFTDHQVSYMLETRPNENMTPFTFKHTVTVHRNLWGNAYIKMNFKGKNVVSLDILDPSKVTIKKENGKVWYTYQDGVKQMVYGRSEIIHLPYLSLDGITGKSPISIARETAGTMKASRKFLNRFYENGTSTKGILKTPGQLNGQAKEVVRSEWQRANSGYDSAGKVAILDAGFDYVPISMPLDDAEFIATQKFNVAEIARIFNVPLHMLNELDRATFSNIEHQSMEFIQNTIQPELIAWEEEMNYQLFTEGERRQLYVKFNLSSAMRGDSQSRAAYYREMLNTGVYSINEVRALEERDATDFGDKHRVDLNHVSIDIADEYQLAKSKGGGN